MSNAVVTKQGQPSAPGTVVDTSAAAVVDILDPRVADAAERDAALLAQDEGKSVERKQNIAAKAKAMTHPARAKDEAVKAVTGKGSTKAKASKPAAAKADSVHRLTNEWSSAKGKDVKVKDRIKTPDGIVLDVIGRWTKKTAKGNVPMVTGHIVTLPAGETAKKVGNRHNAVAAEVTHVTKK